MDYSAEPPNVAPSSTSASSSQKVSATTQNAVLLARNIQKFFQTKSEELLKKAAANSQQNSDLDVPAVLHDVDLILQGRSVEDGRLLLRGMVADLLKEVDLLRFRLEETTDNLTAAREERDVVNNDYKDQLFSLLLALQNATEHGHQQHRNNNNSTHTDALKERIQKGEVLTAEEAMEMAFSSLTNKIETLNIEQASLRQQLAKSLDRVEDLQSENAAKVHKIHALEQQFKSINKKRNKVVQQLTTTATTTTSTTSSSTTEAKPLDSTSATSTSKPAALVSPASSNQATSPSVSSIRSNNSSSSGITNKENASAVTQSKSKKPVVGRLSNDIIQKAAGAKKSKPAAPRLVKLVDTNHHQLSLS